MNLKNKTVCLIDSGSFLSWLSVLKRDFGRVLYYNPCESQFPTSNENGIGKGIEGVELVNNLLGDRKGVGFWEILDQIDLFVFLDVGHADKQILLEKLGKRVWGSRHGDDIELFRWEAKHLLTNLGLPVQPCRRVVGIPALRELLAKEEDRWVKISGTRGDQESFHHVNLEMSEPVLRNIENQIGQLSRTMEFVVENPLEPAVELGIDTFCIDGEFPDDALQGIEVKDEGYVAKVVPYKDFPEQVRLINDALKPFFQETGYKNCWSIETRVPKSLKSYLIDATARAGSPPGELMQELITNWGDIFWEGARGKLVQPKWKAKFGAQAIIYSAWAESHPQQIWFPAEHAESVKLKNYHVFEGKVEIAQQPGGLCGIGSVVATGDTMLEAVKACNEIAKTIEGQGIKVRLDSLPKAIREFNKGEEMGIKFKGLQLPSEEELNQALQQ